MLITPAVLFDLRTYLPCVVQSNRLRKRGLNSLVCDYPVERNHTRVFASKTWIRSRAASRQQQRESQSIIFVLLNKRHNILILDVLSWLKRWKRGSMMKHADPLLNALVLGRQRWRALIGLEKILVVIVTANRVHALSWDVMNSAVPLPCGGYLLRNVFLEVGLYTLCNDV